MEGELPAALPTGDRGLTTGDRRLTEEAALVKVQAAARGRKVRQNASGVANTSPSRMRSGVAWEGFAAGLPAGTSEEESLQRETLWQQIDSNSNGYISVSDLEKALKRLQSGSKQAPNLSFALQTAKEEVSKCSRLGPQFIEYGGEFDLVLLCVAHFWALCGLYMCGEGTSPEDLLLDSEDLEMAHPLLTAWGLPTTRPIDEQMRSVPRETNGAARFDQFALWVMRLHVSCTSLSAHYESYPLPLAFANLSPGALARLRRDERPTRESNDVDPATPDRIASAVSLAPERNMIRIESMTVRVLPPSSAPPSAPPLAPAPGTISTQSRGSRPQHAHYIAKGLPLSETKQHERAQNGFPRRTTGSLSSRPSHAATVGRGGPTSPLPRQAHCRRNAQAYVSTASQRCANMLCCCPTTTPLTLAPPLPCASHHHSPDHHVLPILHTCTAPQPLPYPFTTPLTLHR